MIAHQRAKLCCWGQYCILGFHCSSSLAVFLLCTKSTCVKTINWLVPGRNFRNYFSTWQKSATRLFYFGLKDYFQNFRQNNINVHPFQPRELFESRKGVSFDSVFWIFSLHFLHFRFSFLFFFSRSNLIPQIHYQIPHSGQTMSQVFSSRNVFVLQAFFFTWPTKTGIDQNHDAPQPDRFSLGSIPLVTLSSELHPAFLLFFHAVLFSLSFLAGFWLFRSLRPVLVFLEPSHPERNCIYLKIFLKVCVIFLFEDVFSTPPPPFSSV